MPGWRVHERSENWASTVSASAESGVPRLIDSQFDALKLVAQSRHWLVRDEQCLDTDGPALLEYRAGLSTARRLLRAGFADGLVAPTYQHISPDLREYERFLKDRTAQGWFVPLAISETGR